MRRTHIALLLVSSVILLLAFLLSRGTLGSAHGAAFDPPEEAIVDSGISTPSSIEQAEQRVDLQTPLDPSAEAPLRRMEATAVAPTDPPRNSYTFRVHGGGKTRLATHIAEDMREPALSWCAIVGIPDEKRKDVADLIVRTQRKWQRMCDSAGSSQSVNALELEGLREWRRDELGRLVGFEAGDALIAGIRVKQGF